MKLRKCLKDGYTLKEKCGKCGEKTSDAHYKFIKLKSFAEKDAERKVVE